MKKLNVQISKIEYVLPTKRITNAILKELHPGWNTELIESKTGVFSRHWAGEDETALDLALSACRKLLEENKLDPTHIDALIFCTQSPDHIMPHNSALLHAKLGLDSTSAAFDFNLACSGYIYGLAIASSMMETLDYRNVLLVTADTYSKFIHPEDRSTISLFGDAGAVTLLERGGGQNSTILDITLGTDGLGGEKFFIKAGGQRYPYNEETAKEKKDIAGNLRTDECIYMDGPAVLKFVEQRIPSAIARILERNNLAFDDVDLILFHQASKLALDRLQKILNYPESKTYINIGNIGNTVSASLPILLKDAENNRRLSRGDLLLLVGFGVGFSWGCCLLNW